MRSASFVTIAVPSPSSWMRAATCRSASDGSSTPEGWLWIMTPPSGASRATASTAERLPRATARGLEITLSRVTSARKETSRPPARATSWRIVRAASGDSRRGRDVTS